MLKKARIYILTIMGMFINLSFNLSADAKEYVFACNNWPPYTASDLPKNGVLGHVFTAAAERANINVRLEIMPWNRAVSLVKKGRITGVYCSSYAQSRESWLHFSQESFLQASGGFFIRKEAAGLHAKNLGKNLDNLKSYRIGVLKSGFFETFLKEKTNTRLHIAPYRNEVIGMRMLAGGRYDLILMSKREGLQLLADKLPEIQSQIIYHQNLHTTHTRPGVSHKWPNSRDIIAKIDQGYRDLMAEGRLEKIYSYHDFKP